MTQVDRRIVFSAHAEAQLLDLYRYVAVEASPAIADRYTSDIVDYCLSFTVFANRGTRRDEIRPGLRTVGFRRRVMIAFDVTDTTVNILGIYYGGRDFEADFREE